MATKRDIDKEAVFQSLLKLGPTAQLEISKRLQAEAIKQRWEAVAPEKESITKEFSKLTERMLNLRDKITTLDPKTRSKWTPMWKAPGGYVYGIRPVNTELSMVQEIKRAIGRESMTNVEVMTALEGSDYDKDDLKKKMNEMIKTGSLVVDTDTDRVSVKKRTRKSKSV